MRTWRPGPLDERGKSTAALGGRNRTPNYRTRTCRVADYTTPEWVPPRRRSERRSGRRNGGTHCSQAGHELLDLAMPVEPAVAEDPAGGDPDRLGDEAPPFPRALDRARAGRRRRRLQADVVRDVFDARRVVRIGDEHDARRDDAAFKNRAAAASDCHDDAPGRLAQDRASRAPGGRGDSVAPTLASVKRSPGCFPPVTTTTGAMPRR